MKPDACEKNNDAKHACTIALDAVNGPYTIVPDTDQDWYTVDLGATPSAPTTVFVRATQGLDLITTITRVADGAQVGTLSSPTISTTLGTDVSGLLLLHVENRNPRSPVAKPTASSCAAPRDYQHHRRTLPATQLHPTHWKTTGTPTTPLGLA